MNILPKRQDAGELWKSHVIAQMKEPHCWICAQAVREVDRDFFWFVSEQYYEIQVIDKMRLAHGFCPTHTRHLLLTGANSVITTVFSYLTWYVISRLNDTRDLLLQAGAKQNPRELCLRAAAALRPQNLCPMCENLRSGEDINIRALTYALARPDVRDAYEGSPGLCLPHFRQAAYHADWNAVSFLTADMQRRLSANASWDKSIADLLEQTVGLDREQSLRKYIRQGTAERSFKDIEPAAQKLIELGNPDHPWSPTFEQLLVSLAEPGCPVCSACAQGARQYLDWLAQQMERQASSTESWDLTWHVCRAHLWELYSAGYDRAAIFIGKHMIHDWLTRLDRFTAGLGAKPSEQILERLGQGFLISCGVYNPEFGRAPGSLRSRWSKIAAALESPQARLDAHRAIAFRADPCWACTHVHTTARQRLDLILRALEDPLGRKAYQSGWGLCLRHCIEAANLAEIPAALVELLSAQIARLRVVEWELGEASRKDNWSVRYEPKGPETSAWRRAAYQFCGV
jgi:hypothetical protein